jgi:metal-sulfur cluster biosynthetic enzyme
MSDLSARIIEALRTVHDPCCAEKGLSVVDMGLVRRVEAGRDRARVELMLTGGWCPFAVDLLSTIRERLRDVGVGDADVEITWEEPWSAERMSPEARRKLRFLPDPRVVRDRREFVAQAPQRQGGEVER